MLQEGHCIRNQIFNFCGKASSYNHVYEAGSIDTLVRIVDRNGGYTLIPELHLPFDEPQRSNVREIADPPAVREISIVIRQDYIRERAINAVAEVIKGIIPQQMPDERLRCLPSGFEVCRSAPHGIGCPKRYRTRYTPHHLPDIITTNVITTLQTKQSHVLCRIEPNSTELDRSVRARPKTMRTAETAGEQHKKVPEDSHRSTAWKKQGARQRT